MKKNTMIAMVFWAAFQALSNANLTEGQEPVKDYNETSEADRDNTEAFVTLLLENDTENAETIHEAWIKDQVEKGWVRGDVYDESARTNPLIVPFESLPKIEQNKRLLLDAIVTVLS